MNSTPPEPPRLLDRRKLLWWSFWFVFFSTPACVILLPNVLRRIPLPAGWGRMPAPLLMCCGGAVVGGFAAGFILAKLTSKTDAEFISRGIGYGAALVAVYAFIALAGCFLLIAR